MIVPAQKDDALLADIAREKSRDGFRIWWLGQSGYLIQFQNKHCLLDPYLSDSLTKKYATTDKPHVRMTECVIAPERLDFIDVVTSSHNHTDHLDAETLKPLFSVNHNLKMIIPEANRAFVAERVGIDPVVPIGLDDGKSATVGPFTFHGIASAHETVERDEEGRCKFMGYVVQFGLWTIYHSGDTVLHDGLIESLNEFHNGINIALLPINGADPRRRVAGNLSGKEAARLASDIGASVVIPCHYEMFEFNTADPNEEFVPECKRIEQRYHILKCGEQYGMTELT